MDDKTLLERAAKAAGVEGEYECWAYHGFNEGIRQILNGQKCTRPWNPLNHDDQALRLAVKLNLAISIEEGQSWAHHEQVISGSHVQHDGRDPYAATRRAIVRAAAAIGSAHESQ